MPGLFLVYEKVADGLARITSSATVVDSAAHAALLDSLGHKYYYAPLDGYAGYFELDENDQVIAINSREPWGGSLSSSEIKAQETVTLPDVPAAQIRVTGPSTDNLIDHGGGDLRLRIPIPGNYTIAFEAFPFLPFSTGLTVLPAESQSNPAPTTEAEEPSQ